MKKILKPQDQNMGTGIPLLCSAYDYEFFDSGELTIQDHLLQCPIKQVNIL